MTKAGLRPSSEEAAADGRLSARPGLVTGTLPLGASPLGLATGRDGAKYVPPSYQPGRPMGLLVFLHGAGGAGRVDANGTQALANESDYVIVAPDSRGKTWDFITDGQFAGDVTFIDSALAHVFARATIDPTKIWLAGFSDGASYALSLGVTNGDLFRRTAAFSPGFFRFVRRVGRPPIFVSHGTADPILPIELTSQRVVPLLRELGYDVEYREFEGGHQVSPGLARDAIQWLVT